MSKQAKPLSIALGAVVVASLGATGIANAEEEELFSMEELTTGYLIAGGHEEGGCGGDKDEGDDDGDGEGSCGEGKCGSA